jgi:F-type H+-transporting ATPase subunit epsilon
MSDPLHLIITTPASVLVDSANVSSVRAEDESGGFGILPGHADLLTVLPPSVVRWRESDGEPRYCALKSGVLTVTGGKRVAIACRQGALGGDLATLEGRVQALRASETDADRRARVEQMRLHAHAVRQLMRYLRGGGLNAPLPFDGETP